MANMGPNAGRPQQPIKEDSVGPGLQMPMDGNGNLSTFIYDYFLKKGKVELANAMLGHADLSVQTRPRQKKSPGSGVNGVDEMDMEHKDEILKKIETMPEAAIQDQLPRQSFLEDWWCVFWDIWSAGKNRRASPAAAQYMQQNLAKRNMMQRNMMQQSMINMRAGMNSQMGRMNPENLHMNAVNNQRMHQMRNMGNMGPNGQGGMPGDMNNQQRPQSPMSSDNAPSPKRARVGDAPFGTPQMGVGAQNRPVGMSMPGPPGQQPGMVNGLDMPNGPFSNMPGNPQARMQQFAGMNNRFGNVKQDFPGNGAEVMLDDMNLFGADGMSRGMAPNGSQQGGALADYQMQLMLLEQQNKKRLLMARQEQEVNTQGGGPPGATGPMMGGAGPGAGAQFQGLSPGRRNDGQMPMGRGSPAPGFDPSQMPPGMAGQFAFNPQMAPNGMRPGGPGFPQNPGPMQATIEQIRARGPLPAGNWNGGPGAPPGNMGPGQQQGQNNNQNTMPPPSAPNAGPNAGRTNPSSPAPNANNPPTPQQNKNSNAKNNKKETAAKDTKKTKAGGKKGANNPAATPSSEAEGNGPPTPTPPTPITPSAPNNPFKPGQSQPNMQGQNGGQMPQQPGMPGQPDAGGMNAGNPFGQLGDHGNGEVDFNLDFGQDTSDVLEAFDFESFLNADSNETAFAFEPNTFNMNGDGVDVNARE